MLEIRNNAYVFSDACINYGEILISRTRDGNPEGKDVFKYLGVSASEVEFLRSCCEKEYNKPVVLLGHRLGRTSAVLFTGISVLESSMSLAVEMLGSPRRVLRALLLACDDDVAAISPALRAVCEAEKQKTEDICLSDEISLNGVLFFLQNVSKYTGGPGQLFKMSLESAELAGVAITIDQLSLSELYVPSGHVPACGFSSAALLVMAMAARKHSRQRLLFVAVREDAFMCSISLSFEMLDAPRDALKEHLAKVADRLDIPIRFALEDGVFRCEFAPYRPDIARTGVKEPEQDFIYDWDIYWDLYGNK